MLPILISEAAPIGAIITILVIKFALGMIYGFIIDFVLHIKNKNKEAEDKIVDLCEDEHCHCEESILKSAIKHTLSVFVYIFILTLVINAIVELVGEDTLKNFMSGTGILEPILAGLIGLIPNCAASVIITELYLSEIISFGSIIAGLLVNAGAGLLMLFRINKSIKENIGIVITLYILGALTGIIINLIGITI